jgi:hypothetical protein
MLIRMTIALCVGIFGALTISGKDNGQRRFGLAPQVPSAQAVLVEKAPDHAPSIARPASVPPRSIAPDSPSNFAPLEPVMVALAAPESAKAEPAPLGQLVVVGIKSANVRQGPGKEHSVVGRVKAGQQIELLSQDGDWSYIKTIDGSVEGFVASRLLQG